MLFVMLETPKIKATLTPLDRLALFFSAISHDLDHPGLNNAFQVFIILLLY